MIVVKTEAVTRARILAGLSQRSLARKLGKSSGYVSLVESGELTPSPESARKICEALGADFDDLFEIRRSPRVASRA